MRFSAAAAGLLVFFPILVSLPCSGQSADAADAAHIEATQEMISRLSPAQKQQYDQAAMNFSGQNYSEAFAQFKTLLKEVPGDVVLTKFASEAALNTGDTAYALSNMKPIAAANPNDWQAASILTRAYAEAGNKEDRDAGMAHMLELHKRGITPPNMKQYILERVRTSDRTILIFTSLEPWGHYKVYDYAQVFDEEGHLALRLTLESNDTDQPLFAKEHPREAAAGARLFSIDGYGDNGPTGDGQHGETHSTYKFFTGQPSYDTVRETFLTIASDKTSPVSTRVNTPPQ